ncbi:MAG: hypothetical protein B7Y36_03385 [Novosphingobium sp. 28-62-57]|uniref:MBL fold metallo-hydrolase n=1 Tax=Novosphingobium sp. 28-62-57 TaxID=1970409 RepID=UPI000BC49FD1|nr:MBL fold metallo-hydrolase [Novosphingobium sp. 28-62-57]OYZ12555.1 MAG: hypothetical protein B7Y36_03385 [Novosphingobium sp. 28-62-57]
MKPSYLNCTLDRFQWSRGVPRLRWVLHGLLALLCSFFAASPAWADHLIIKRHVTLRETPSRVSQVVTYPPPGTVLRLLDKGARQSGYYRVALKDGRIGWVYFTFVERRAGDPPDWSTENLVAAGTAAGAMAVHYINVDQGAAALVEFPCAAILIDAGGRGAAAGDHLLNYLDKFFARRPDLQKRLEAVFVTHTHVDHNSNLRRIAERFSIGGYIHNGILTGSGRVAAKWMDARVHQIPPIRTLAVTDAMVDASTRGLSNEVIDPVSCPDVDPSIRVLSASYAQNPGWPDGEFENGNNQSLVIRIDYGQASFLFTGDMEETALETLVEKYAGTHALDVDFYEVGHHGSHNGTTAELVNEMTPKAAVISMGPATTEEPWTAWAYGHPRSDVVTLLAHSVTDRRVKPAQVKVADRVKKFTEIEITSAVYATGWDGDVVLHAETDGRYSVELAP